MVVGHVPVAYSLHDPRGLTSLGTHLLGDSSPLQSILFLQSCLIAPYLQSPLIVPPFYFFIYLYNPYKGLSWSYLFYTISLS